MKPTPRLRFVERKIQLSRHTTDIHGGPAYHTVRILQQWWEDDSTSLIAGEYYGEWRDIPLETES